MQYVDFLQLFKTQFLLHKLNVSLPHKLKQITVCHGEFILKNLLHVMCCTSYFGL